MKKRRGLKNILTLSSVLLLGTVVVGSVTSCGPQSTISNTKVVVTGAKNGYIGDTIQLTAQVFGIENQSVTWSSNDVNVATVDANGLVTLVGEGYVQITATSAQDKNAKSSPCNITSFSLENGVKKLEITSLPNKVNYKVNETLSFEGMEITGYSFVNGIRDNSTGVNFELNELKVNVAEGTKLSKKGNVKIEVSKEGYQKTSFEITVNDKIVEKELYISKLPKKTSYTIGEDALGVESTFNSDGLEVREITYEDGKKVKEAVTRDYELSIDNGVEFINEGNHEIVVSKKGFKDATFSVMVYTKDLTVYNLIKTLQTAKNFQVEVLNNVGTTTDSYGFHYIRTYTEKYYDEIQYQNTYNQETKKVEFSTDKVKSHFGFASYKDGETKGVMQFKEGKTGRLQPDSIVSEGLDSWWDKAGTLATLFTSVNLDLLPKETLNGRYVVQTIEVVDDDDDMGTQTALKYPLVSQFLGLCGWSSSLLTIMERFEISITPKGELSMLASFGHFGSTELKVLKIGGAKNDQVEKALNTSNFKPKKTVLSPVNDIKELFNSNNYKRYEYKEGVTSKVYDFYNEKYYMNASTKKGYIELPDGIYGFEGVKEGGSYKLVLNEEKEITNAKNVAEYISEAKPANVFEYVGIGLESIFGTQDNPNGKLYTFSKFDNFSTDLQVCYQSFDGEVLKSLETYFQREVEDGRAWFMASYKDASRTKETVQSVEIWDIAFTGSGGSGMVNAYGDFGNAQVEWVENFLNSGK